MWMWDRGNGSSPFPNSGSLNPELGRGAGGNAVCEVLLLVAEGWIRKCSVHLCHHQALRAPHIVCS